MNATKRKAAQPPALTAEQPETVDTIRAQLVALKAEHNALDRQALGPADVAEAAERSLKSLSDAWTVRLDVAVSRIAGGAYTATEAIEHALSVHQGQRIDAVALVGLVGAGALRDALVARLDGSLIEGPSRAQREARRAEIVAELHRLEVSEERLIVEAENAGTLVLRREDVDIGILLGATYAGSDADAVEAPNPTSAAELKRQQEAALRDIKRRQAAETAAPQSAPSQYLARGRD